MRIRTAKRADIPSLETMYRTEIENHAERAQQFANDLVLRYNTLLAVENNVICGTASWEARGGLDDGVVEMIGLGVTADFRRQGVGKQLVQAMIDEATQYYKTQGYQLRVILLFMEHNNEIARKFYIANKFKEVASIESLYPSSDASIWTKHL
ncbi:MAG: N-acetyltransferase [Candidatus Thorarchaeota archaeon]|nr:N-acetyltransferase [Candidatus Thorarchaeota archaeon]